MQLNNSLGLQLPGVSSACSTLIGLTEYTKCKIQLIQMFCSQHDPESEEASQAHTKSRNAASKKIGEYEKVLAEKEKYMLRFIT